MNRCVVCQEKRLKLFYKPDCNISVSSDNAIINRQIELFLCTNCGHIQKFPERELLDTIYKTYQTNKLLPNSEQLKFDGNASKSRSFLLLENIIEYLPDSGKALDIGSGSGTMLKALHILKPKIDLYAFDLNDNNIGEFVKIPKFKEFFVDIFKIDKKFDLIIASHVLEHVIELDSFLKRVSSLLKPNGLFLIQVPNICQNPLDIFIYDHISHFTPNSLQRLLSKYFKAILLPNKQIDKEITLLIRNDFFFSLKESKQDDCFFDSSCIDRALKKIKKLDKKVSVFGSSPICTLFGALLGDRLDCFYDEDSKKVGLRHLNTKIVSLKEYKGEDVVLSFLGDFARKIVERLDYVRFIEILK